MTQSTLLAYTHVVIPDPAQGGYTATFVELPGCVAEGDTADVAIAALYRAGLAWMQAARAAGQSIPAPLACATYSGRLALRIPKGLHRRMALQAALQGVSLNHWIATALAQAVGETTTPATPRRRGRKAGVSS